MGFTSKPYELNFEERGEYLYARVEAEALDPHSATEYLKRIAEESKRTELNKILIDRRIPMMMPDADNYLLIEEMTKFLGHRKIAFLNPFMEIEDAMRFSEVMSRNRGAPYRVFNTEEKALQWLTNDGPFSPDMHTSDAQ